MSSKAPLKIAPLTAHSTNVVFTRVNWVDLLKLSGLNKSFNNEYSRNKHWHPIYKKFFPKCEVKNTEEGSYKKAFLSKIHEVLLSVKNSCALVLKAYLELCSDRYFMIEAVCQSALAFEYASEELKADREVVLAAVIKSGWAIDYASNALQTDREVVLAAVSQYGRALLHRSPELKADKEVVLAAVTQNAFSLGYAAEELKTDKDFMLFIIRHNGEAILHISKSLKGDATFIKEAALISESARKKVLKSNEFSVEIKTAVKALGFASGGSASSSLGFFGGNEATRSKAGTAASTVFITAPNGDKVEAFQYEENVTGPNCGSGTGPDDLDFSMR